MIRRPPCTTRTDTLFPYTTLFRSPDEPALAVKEPCRLPAHARCRAGDEDGFPSVRASHNASHDSFWNFAVPHSSEREAARQRGMSLNTDRKSTRLNSSH